ncbi:DUF6404 family protein [Maritalea porphyrae]
MSDFEEKYDRALVELEQKGMRTDKFRLLNALNKPFDFCVRKLQLRPIYYASYFEMWLRSAPFYFIVMAAVSLLLLRDKSSWFEQERWVGWVVSTLVFATIIPVLLRHQAKRANLSRWEDL